MNAMNVKVNDIRQILKDINKKGASKSGFGKFGDYIHNLNEEHVQ